MVKEVDPAAKSGDIVNVYDKSGVLFGRGIYNAKSMIALRMLVHDDRQIDEGFWRPALQAAIDLRRRHALDTVTDAYRLVHSEGDGLSGLILERYADVLVFEFFSLGMFQRVEMLANIAGDILGKPISLDRPDVISGNWRVAVRVDENVERQEGFRSPPTKDSSLEDVIIREHGVRYRVNVVSGHKTGFFCDQRDNRLKLARLARDASVLDLCSYTGGFGLAAKTIGGAKEVACVDLDEAAIEIAKANANLNQVRITCIHSDVFPYLRQMIANTRRFDVVVLDPPKFALSRDAFDDAIAKYFDMNQLAMQTVSAGGIYVTCSCSGLVSAEVFFHTIQRAAKRAQVRLQMFDRTGAGPDHPVMLNCPESEYLKVLWFRRVGG